MQVRIHRGAAEIGGSCVELESGGARLVLDIGLPLDLIQHDADFLRTQLRCEPIRLLLLNRAS
jgi:Cft2 family RNA processing exonuclease